MIRNDIEYREAQQRLAAQEEQLKQQAEQLRTMKLSKDEVKRVLDPVRSFMEQIKDEIETYERLKRGEFDELLNLNGLGQMLIALRISKSISQRELAERLGVSESQISRDERNEYHGVTVDRANRILEALEAQVRTTVIATALPKPVRTVRRTKVS